jgi:hypothetical protein
MWTLRCTEDVWSIAVWWLPDFIPACWFGSPQAMVSPLGVTQLLHLLLWGRGSMPTLHLEFILYLHFGIPAGHGSHSQLKGFCQPHWGLWASVFISHSDCLLPSAAVCRVTDHLWDPCFVRWHLCIPVCPVKCSPRATLWWLGRRNAWSCAWWCMQARWPLALEPVPD